MRNDRLWLELSTSWLLLGLLASAHGVALFAIWIARIEPGYQLAFSIAVIVSLLVSIQQRVPGQCPDVVTSVTFAHHQWHLELNKITSTLVELQSPVLITSFLLVLNFKDINGKKYSVVVFPDSASTRQIRETRIFFKFYQPKVGGTKMVSTG